MRGKAMKKRMICLVLLFVMAIGLISCGRDIPPDDGTPKPDPHTGSFMSEYGTITFNGDGESILIDFTSELAEAVGLPVEEQSGSYVFLFQHKEWRYDKAERFRITVADDSYDFINVFTLTDKNTIALQSPFNGEETILFKKGEQ